MASSATPLHDSLIELAIPDAHAHAIKWYLKVFDYSSPTEAQLRLAPNMPCMTLVKNIRPPAWVDGKSGDGKQVYYKSWPNAAASDWAWLHGPVLAWDLALAIGGRVPEAVVTFEPREEALGAWHEVKGEAMSVNEALYSGAIEGTVRLDGS